VLFFLRNRFHLESSPCSKRSNLLSCVGMGEDYRSRLGIFKVIPLPPSDTFFPGVPTAIIANLYPTCPHIRDSGARASVAWMAFATQSRAAQHLHPQNSPTKLVPVPAPVSSVLTGTGFCLRACRPAGAVTSPAILSAICVGMTRGYSCPEQRGRHRYLSPRLGGGQRLTMSRILQAQLSQL